MKRVIWWQALFQNAIHPLKQTSKKREKKYYNCFDLGSGHQVVLQCIYCLKHIFLLLLFLYYLVAALANDMVVLDNWLWLGSVCAGGEHKNTFWCILLGFQVHLVAMISRVHRTSRIHFNKSWKYVVQAIHAISRYVMTLTHNSQNVKKCIAKVTSVLMTHTSMFWWLVLCFPLCIQSVISKSQYTLTINCR